MVRRSASFFVATAALVLSAAVIACDDKDAKAPDLTIAATSPSSASSLAPTSGTTITPGPGVTLYRWVNLSILVPDGSGIRAGTGVVDDHGRPLRFVVTLVDPEDSRIASTVVLDSENGAIVEEEVLSEHRKEIDRVLATLTLGPLDSSAAPWPYTGEPTADLVRENVGGISFIRPSPSTGLYVGGGIGDPGGVFVDLYNERSTAFVSFVASGSLVFDTSAVVAEDLPVFERWLGTVKQCGTEIECPSPAN